MSEPLVVSWSWLCPQCGAEAEAEEDGDLVYYACPHCGAEFGHHRAPQGPSCAAGLRFSDIPVAAGPAQPPGTADIESAGERQRVYLGPTISRRQE